MKSRVNTTHLLLFGLFILSINKKIIAATSEAPISKTQALPILGWSSWNEFWLQINEPLIKAQADAMVSSGMANAGYRYINIDDGWQAGRDKNGNLLVRSSGFPSGMRALSDYIRSNGLIPGMYTDAGMNTCGSIGTTGYVEGYNGINAGLSPQNDQKDLNLILNTWNYDFIKVDWCGGGRAGFNPKERYTQIGQVIKSVKPEAIYNQCSWSFRGAWVMAIHDSWRISGDIEAKWESITHIIDLNADLAPYAGLGHYNDMDMLQVGRGMNFEEDKAHFSMWAIMTSPLLAGNDLRKMSQQTIDILTNTEVLALNQDSAAFQAVRVRDDGDLELWVKPLGSRAFNSKQKGVALLNRSSSAKSMKFTWDEIGIAGKATVRDLWEKANKGEYENSYQANVPAHGVVVLKIEASDYGKTTFEPEMVGSFSGASISVARNNFSSGIGSVGYLGMGNEVVLDVCVALAGTYSLKIKASTGERRSLSVETNKMATQEITYENMGWDKIQTKDISIDFKAGENKLRFFNNNNWAPDLDRIEISGPTVTPVIQPKEINTTTEINPNKSNTYNVSGQKTTAKKNIILFEKHSPKVIK